MQFYPIVEDKNDGESQRVQVFWLEHYKQLLILLVAADGAFLH